MKTLKERFDEKWIEDKNTGCWEWQAGKDRNGYGVLGINQKPVRAHTVSWMLYKEEPLPQVVRHRCDNPSCCNPDCLEGGTNKQNSEDMVQRGRSCQGERHCFAILTEKQAEAIKEIRSRYYSTRVGAGQGLISFLARFLELPYRAVASCARNRSWQHINPETKRQVKNDSSGCGFITQKKFEAVQVMCARHPNRRAKESRGLLKFLSRHLDIPYSTVRDLACGRKRKHFKV